MNTKTIKPFREFYRNLGQGLTDAHAWSRKFFIDITM